MGAQMVKEVASKTADVAGDRNNYSYCTCSKAIVTAGLKNVAAGANPMDLWRGIDKAVEKVVEMSPQDEQEKLATITKDRTGCFYFSEQRQ